MFEQEISESIQRITRDVLQERTLISLSDILNEGTIPDRFKSFFRTEAEWWVYSDAVARMRDRRFDFGHPELRSLLEYLEQVQVRHARFERDDFLSVLDSAVKLTYNYICRPQTTLKWYVFRGEPTKPIGETLLRMEAFTDYPYFHTVFAEWVERKREERPTFDSISSKEFERIVRRIDDQILLSCTIEDLLEIMDPLFSFVGKGEARSVPIEALIVYFDDKNIRRLVHFLESARGHHTHITPDLFGHLMEDLLNTADEEPEADFSSVYQDDALDAVVRSHLEGGAAVGAGVEAGLPDIESIEMPERGSQNEPDSDVSGPSADGSDQREEDRTYGEGLRSDDPVANAFDYEEDVLDEETGGDYQEHGRNRTVEEIAVDEEDEAEVERDAADDDETDDRGENDFFLSQSLVDERDEQHGPVEWENSDEWESEEDREDRREEDGEGKDERSDEPDSEQPPAPDRSDEVDQDRDEGEGVERDEPDQEEDGKIEEEEDVTDETDDDGEGDDIGQEDEENSTEAADDDERQNVRAHIDAMLERKVVKKIFNRDRKEYERTLDLLNGAETWRDASKVLDELFIRYEVDPYSRTAIRFTDAIYGRYLTPINGN